MRSLWIGALTLSLSLGPVAAQTDEVASVVSRYGLRAVDPQPAREFSLPIVGGGERSLSDFSGRWVVLTFWATWCGPCRSEMPSLERLHLNRGSAGVAVVGVSVDRRAAQAESFVAEYGLTFPNLWDSRGEVGGAYRASSIPLSYVIDPSGSVVAVSVGARDWMALQPMIDELLELRPAGESTGSSREAYETTAEPLDLPSSLEPPSAEASVVGGPPRVGKPFAVDVRVRWAGHFEDYLLHPPKLHLPDGIEQLAASASTTSADGRSLVNYRIELRADQPGSYALSPIEVVYTVRDATEPVSTRIGGPTIEVDRPTLLGLSPSTAMWTVGGVVSALLAGVWFARRGFSKRSTQEPDLAAQLGSALQQRLDEARGRRIEGDLRGAALALAEIELELGCETDAELEALERRLDGARYGGASPSREELDFIERNVARRVKELEGDPRRAERAALKLRDQAG